MTRDQFERAWTLSSEIKKIEDMKKDREIQLESVNKKGLQKVWFKTFHSNDSNLLPIVDEEVKRILIREIKELTNKIVGLKKEFLEI